jgi:hypothetical protein
MRRILLGGLGAVALVVGVPGSALAQHHVHQRSHHKSHHAYKVRFEHFGSNLTPSSSTGATGAMGSTTTTTPSQDAGTIASFTNNVLTIKLNDGSSVSGLVATDTQIECTSATAQVADAGGGSGSSDENGNGNGDGNSSAQSGDGNAGAQDGGDNGDQNNSQQTDDPDDNSATTPAPVCDSSSLVAGAVVHEATLRVGSGGAQFTDVVLSQ